MLPIDDQLPAIVSALSEAGTLVLEAPPGAGKTTRLPPALLDICPGEIVVLEPRRLAARLAAARVASELGTSLGDRVGFTVRYENKSSKSTRIRFVTEGVLTRRLISDPSLSGVSAVLLDEFHERHVQGDLALALLRRLRERRPELKVAVLSATLQGESVARFLGGAPYVRTEGRAYPVDVSYTEERDDRPLELRVVSAVRQLLHRDLRGHVLVFLPGAREIRACQQALGKLASEHELAVFPLHGELSVEEQDRALATSTRRKILLSTNVAESSVTLEGIEAVIDSGLVRRAKHDPWLLFSELLLGPCSRASAIQRAGRAGRTGPGRAIRLYSANDFARRPEHDEPEIVHTDLAPVALDLAAAGALDTPLLDAPAAGGLNAARALLVELGLLDLQGQVTALGRRAARLPVHPRVGRFLLEAQQRGVLARACAIAALLGERDPRRRDFEAAGARRVRDAAAEPSDIEALADRLEEARASRFAGGVLRAMQLDVAGVQRIERARQALCRELGAPKHDEGHPSEIDAALTVAFFDRVAKRRVQGARDLAMVGGQVCELAEDSVVRDAPLMLCLQGEKRASSGSSVGAGMKSTSSVGRTKPLIRSAHRIEPELLLELFPARIEERVRARFDAATGKVSTRAEVVYVVGAAVGGVAQQVLGGESQPVDGAAGVPGAGTTEGTALAGVSVAGQSGTIAGGLVLDDSPVKNGAEAVELLVSAALTRGVHTLLDADKLEQWRARAELAQRRDPSVVPPDDAAIESALREIAVGASKLEELEDAGLLDLIRANTPGQAVVERLIPERLTLPSGRSTLVHYARDRAPWVESYLQDFCGLAETPEVGGEKLVVHLLAPNRRAVQITQDLRSFWSTHYPKLRPALSRRYPRHAWPTDPSTPVPARHRG